MNSKELLEKLIRKSNLSVDEISFFLNEFIAGNINEYQMTAFLVALRIKGETADEITGLIRGMREHMISFPEHPEAFDTCGTGGDATGTFNISTSVAFVIAGAGVPVIKHGNKAASSLCGSADVLSALGVNIMLTPEEAKQVFEEVGMVFLFAPLYHPVMKKIIPIRKALGTRTVFNYLGPFLNPARVKRQIVGVPNLDIAKILAQVATQLSYDHLLLVTGNSNMDEIDTTGPSTVYDIQGNVIVTETIEPQKLGFKKVSLSDIKGGEAFENATIIRSILNGEKGAKRDIVILNSAYALHIAGKVTDIKKGIVMAEESIDKKSALMICEKLVQESKKYEK